jgi:hypothetical protein
MDWLPGRTTIFNVQILNAAHYEALTGERPCEQPIDASDYKEFGLPLYKMYEEPSGISGDFSAVKSIAEVDKIKEETVEPRTVTIRPGQITSSNDPLREFCTVQDLKNEFDNYYVANF